MFCKYCGKQLSDGNKFCVHCGKNLADNPPVLKVPVLEPAKSLPPHGRAPEPRREIPMSTPEFKTEYKLEEKSGKEKPGKEKSGKRGIWVALIALVAVAAAVFGGLVLFGGKQELTAFAADERYLVSEVETTVTFTVSTDKEVDSIALYQDGTEVGKMRDNGEAGDALAGDGIYTCALALEETVQKLTTLEFTCGSGRSKTGALEVYVFPSLDETTAQEAREDYQQLAENIADTVDMYTDDRGNIPQEDRDAALEKVHKVLDQAIEDQVVLHYSTTEHTVFVKMTSGLAMLWAPRDELHDAADDNVSVTVLTLQPSYTEMGGEGFGGDFTGYELPEDVNYILEMLDVSGQKLRDTLPNYRFPNSQNHDNSAVTLDVIRSFGENQIILWHGHGYYDSTVKSCLVTGEYFDWNAWWWDLGYFCDCVSDRIVMGFDKVVISSKYISKYCGSMNNTLVYLGACSSGKTPELANAFTKKGAVAVANSETILRTYNVIMLYSTLDQMLKVNPQSGKFFTLTEALAAAKSIYGENDSDSRYDVYYDPATKKTSFIPGANTITVSGIGATPQIFGNGQFRLMEEVPSGIISGKVAQASDRTTPIAGATIDVYLGDVLYTSVTADSEGQYALELPFGDCAVEISAPGYISFLSYTQVQAGETSYMETFLMVQGDENTVGTASGQVINSISGSGEGNVLLSITENWNNAGAGAEVILSVTTDENGFYEVELPCGNYTVIAEKEGFSRSYFNIVVQEGHTENQDGTITPEISGTNYLITLTWGENPRDVDAHMAGYMADGDSFHVYFAEQTKFKNGELICELDYDDRYSYGPEHITLNASDSGSYYYFLHRFDGYGTLASSEAKVTIEQGNRVIAVFYIPTDLGSGDYWNVFCIRDGEIVVANTITSEPDVYYAD